MADPKYVRLAEHLTRGGRYDINSGWGISGYDVREMPDSEDEPNAYKFVKTELGMGRLEGASKAEFDEAHPDIAKALGYKTEDGAVQYQEREVQREAAKVHRKVKARRAGEAEEDAFDADQRRREATLKAQRAQEGRSGSSGRSRAAAEAEGEAEDATNEHLRREAEVRSQGGAPVVPGANPVVDDDDDEDDTEGDAYDEMGKSALVEEAKRRDLPHSGSADALRDRLRAHDAEADSDEDEDDSDEDDESEDDGQQS